MGRLRTKSPSVWAQKLQPGSQPVVTLQAGSTTSLKGQSDLEAIAPRRAGCLLNTHSTQPRAPPPPQQSRGGTQIPSVPRAPCPAGRRRLLVAPWGISNRNFSRGRRPGGGQDSALRAGAPPKECPLSPSPSPVGEVPDPAATRAPAATRGRGPERWNKGRPAAAAAGPGAEAPGGGGKWERRPGRPRAPGALPPAAPRTPR